MYLSIHPEMGPIFMDTTELTCRELVELVTAYLEGALPAGERLRFELHLADCPYCQTYLEQIRQTMALVGQITESSIDPDVEAALLRQFRAWKQEEGR